MLLNGKPEELTRYSKLKYDAKLFIQKRMNCGNTATYRLDVCI